LRKLLSRHNSSRPVGTQCHVWCDSCLHTGNILRVAKCAIHAGIAAAAASARKTTKDSALSATHMFFFRWQ